jgi:hypothetical protein
MKPVNMDNFTGLDRIATWSEVRYAISAFSFGIHPLKSVRDDYLEVDLDLTDRAENLCEDDMWLAIVNKMPDCKSN